MDPSELIIGNRYTINGDFTGEYYGELQDGNLAFIKIGKYEWDRDGYNGFKNASIPITMSFTPPPIQPNIPLIKGLRYKWYISNEHMSESTPKFIIGYYMYRNLQTAFFEDCILSDKTKEYTAFVPIVTNFFKVIDNAEEVTPTISTVEEIHPIEEDFVYEFHYPYAPEVLPIDEDKPKANILTILPDNNNDDDDDIPRANMIAGSRRKIKKGKCNKSRSKRKGSKRNSCSKRKSYSKRNSCSKRKSRKIKNV